MSSAASSAALARVLYRSLLSVSRSLTEPLRLRLPVEASPFQWGQRAPQFGWVPAARLSAADDVLHPALHERFAEPAITPEELQERIRSEFRSAAARLDAADGLDLGLHTLKALNEQLAMAKRSSAVLTEQPAHGAAVVVEATSSYLGRDGPAFVFQYRVRITNAGAVPVQVIGRSWRILNNDGTTQAEVPRGSPGVVGQTPKLLPGGDSFEYASGTTLSTPGGSISGSLQLMSFVGGDGGGGVDGGEQPADDRKPRVLPFDAEVGTFECLMDDDSD